MLALMKNEVVLLKEGLSALGANVRAERATTFGMAFVVKHETVLGHEALSTELTKMRFGLLLWRRGDLNDRGLLDLLLLGLLLSNLDRLLLHDMLFHLSVLLLRLCLNLNLLVLLRAM
jgi:hypothetical protein